ncbi:MAG: hypothetical protein U1E49_10610 [Hyphomicrobiaceae bacterium]
MKDLGENPTPAARVAMAGEIEPRGAWQLMALPRSERAVYIWLSVWTLVYLVYHATMGPEPLHFSHIELGRHLLFGDPIVAPAHPMFGYAIIIAALGPWTLLFNAAIGWIGFVLAYRWLGLGRMPASLVLYAAIVAYAGMISSWNDHAPWLGLVMLSLAFFQRYGDRGPIAGLAVGLLWGMAYNIRSEALLLFPLYLATQAGLEAFGYAPRRFKCHAAALATFLMCMVPWAIYTTSVLGKYTPGTTHSWSVAYYSLGLVPNNPYNIVTQDEWIADRAAEFGEPSPWTERSNEHFQKEFVQLIASDPVFFMKKMVWGVYTFVRFGPYVPNLKLLAGNQPADQMRVRLAFRDLASTLHIPRFMWSASMQALPAPSPSPTSVIEGMLAAISHLIEKSLMLACLVALAQTAWLMLRPATVLHLGAPLTYAVSTIALTLFVSAVFLPTTRMSTVPFVFSAVLLQALRCDRKQRSGSPRYAAGQPSAAE